MQAPMQRLQSTRLCWSRQQKPKKEMPKCIVVLVVMYILCWSQNHLLIYLIPTFLWDYDRKWSCLKQRAYVRNSEAVFEVIGSQLKQWGKDLSETVGLGLKRRARVQNSGVKFKTVGSHSK